MFTLLQLAVVPPAKPVHCHVRVVPQAVCALSPVTVPDEQAPLVVLQAPFTVHEALAFEQLATEPPLEPSHSQARVVSQAVWLLSFIFVPVAQDPAVLPQLPLTVHDTFV